MSVQGLSIELVVGPGYERRLVETFEPGRSKAPVASLASAAAR
jgi:hypothetical protein